MFDREIVRCPAMRSIRGAMNILMHKLMTHRALAKGLLKLRERKRRLNQGKAWLSVTPLHGMTGVAAG
jgi:hypothetical protein